MQTKNKTFFRSYGKALKSYLKEKGIKQSYIVQNTGKGKDEISNYVNDKVMPNDESQLKIENLLGITIKEVRPNQWVLRSSPVDQAHNGVDQAEQLTADYKASGLPSDDPEKLLELCETLIRTARELLKKKPD